ncbi:uncharacterized protein LOC132741192 [Ruditapes philippinarum]|uniref:uncharacterized protein LOC132741192 n=1 Tax=Ruditapes philippinarum TaxID=129788 RepID=UPI00295B5A97|nr:uncharacterized protein LOC132741192 [Ruditapes philippinarum]
MAFKMAAGKADFQRKHNDAGTNGSFRPLKEGIVNPVVQREVTSNHAAPERLSPIGCESKNSVKKAPSIPNRESAVQSIKRTAYLSDSINSPRSVKKAISGDDLENIISERNNQLSAVQSIKRTSNLSETFDSPRSVPFQKNNNSNEDNTNNNVTTQQQSALESIKRTTFISDSVDSPRSVSKLSFHM